MESYFSSNFFSNNRLKLRQLFMGTAPIVITANGILQRGGDSVMPFVQDANFWYLTGIDLPDIILVIDKNDDYLIVPELNPIMEFFDGAIDIDFLAKRSGITNIYYKNEGIKKLEARLKKVKHLATLSAMPIYQENYHFYANPARRHLIHLIKSFQPNINFLDLSNHLTRLRVIKQPEELLALQRAIDITIGAIKSSMTPSKLVKYKSEYELEANLSKFIRNQGALGHAFEPIVAGGAKACILHSINNQSLLRPNDLVLVDMGAEVEHYAADITRTYIIGSPSKRQREVHQAVIDVQDYALSQIKPNVLPKDYEHKVELYMGEKLRELGLIKTITSENVRKYYPSATSHFLGLDVHDVGEYQRPLPVGAVLTVEPGIYIREEGIGVRIEDDVLLDEPTNKILSKKLSKNLTLN